MKTKEKSKLFGLSILEYFKYVYDEVLVEMAQDFPVELKRMCNLITLDTQLEIEREEKMNKIKW